MLVDKIMMLVDLLASLMLVQLVKKFGSKLNCRDVTNRFFHEPNEHETSKQNHEPSRAS